MKIDLKKEALRLKSPSTAEEEEDRKSSNPHHLSFIIPLNLDRLKERAGLKHESLGKLLRLDESAISRILSPRSNLLTLSKVDAIMDAYTDIFTLKELLHGLDLHPRLITKGMCLTETAVDVVPNLTHIISTANLIKNTFDTHALKHLKVALKIVADNL